MGILEDLENALKDIADLKSRAEMDTAEKDSLQQEVVQLKDEVSRLQSGVEQITRIARGVSLSICFLLACILNVRS